MAPNARDPEGVALWHPHARHWRPDVLEAADTAASAKQSSHFGTSQRLANLLREQLACGPCRMERAHATVARSPWQPETAK